MNYFSYFRRSTVLKKTVSMIALLALVAGSVSGIAFSSIAHANNGIQTAATPNTGTLAVGDTLEVHMTVALDPNDTNPVVTTACTVNGVDVKDTFENLTTGTDGHFKVVYTVAEGDQSRAAGEVPINCTLMQTGSVTITAFDDANTVAINTEGGSTGGGGSTATAPSFSSVSISPSSGSISLGETAEVTFVEASGQTDLSVAGTCKVNNVDVSNTFVNVGDGSYKVIYTVGAQDGERPEGMTLLNCSLGNSAGNVVAHHPWSDGNTLSIDVNGDGAIDNGTNTLGFTVSASPFSGVLGAGDTLQVFMQDPLPSGDLVVGSGGCTVNGVDVANTISYQGNGLYRVSYIVGANDAERVSGSIPVSCTLQNQTGSVHLTSFSDANTVSIELADGGTGGGDPVSTVSAGLVPKSGTFAAGQTLETYIEVPGENFLSLFGSCFVNNIDVSDSFQNFTGGLYRVDYIIGASDAERESGEIPLNCVLRSDSGEMFSATSWTDGNTVAIDTDNSGVVTEPTGTETPFIAGVFANPVSGSLDTGDFLEVYIQEGTGEESFTPGLCSVNEREISSTFENLTSGFYKVTYTVAAGDTERAAGEIPLSCDLGRSGGPILAANAFTDGNTVAIDITGSTGGNTGGNTGGAGGSTGGDTGGNTGGTGGSSTTSISFSSVSANPNTGTRSAGDHLMVNFQESSNATNLSLGSCSVNGVAISNLEHLGNGQYRIDYLIGANDADRSAGTVPLSCSFTNSSGATATVSAFTDGNTVAIDVTPDTTGGTGGNTGSTGTSTDSTGNSGNNNNIGGNSTSTPIDIFWASITPNSGVLNQGGLIQVYFQETNLRTDLTIAGSCTVNNVAAPLESLGTGLYRLSYSIGAADSDRAAGMIPISCSLQNTTGATTTISTWSDNNTLAIDVNNNGSFGDTGNTGGDDTGNNNATTTPGTATSTVGVLAVDSITQIRSTAVAGAGFDSGWAWVFDITVPSDEPIVEAKFGDWIHSNGSSTIDMENNMRISSEQGSSTAPIVLTAAGIYSEPIEIVEDLDSETPGLQIQIRVEMQIPAGSAAGSYGTYYGIQSRR